MSSDVCVLSGRRHRLVEAGLASCGPQHCRVMNDLMAEEVSTLLQLSRCGGIYVPQNRLLDTLNKLLSALFMMICVQLGSARSAVAAVYQVHSYRLVSMLFSPIFGGNLCKLQKPWRRRICRHTILRSMLQK